MCNLKKGLLILFLLVVVVTSVYAESTFFVKESELLTLNVNAQDPDVEDVLEYFFSQPFDVNGSWVPSYDDAGNYTVNIIASDGEFNDSMEVLVVVLDKDRAPIIIASGEQVVKENVEFILPVDAFDPDGDNLSLSLVDMPEGTVFFNNTIFWQPSYDSVNKSWFKRVLNYFGLNFLKDKAYYKFVVNAVGKDLDSNAEIIVKVLDINRPPKISSMNDITISEGEEISFSPFASDLDGDRIKFYYDGFDNNEVLSFNSAGNHTVTVTASDGLDSDSTSVKVFVKDVNRAPVLEVIKPIYILEGKNIEFTLSAIDPDEDNLSFAPSNYSQMPLNSSFVNNTFSWTPGFDTLEDVGSKEFKINFSVFDGLNSDTKEIFILVEDVNRKPSVLAFEEIEEINISVGESLIFEVTASDLDGDNLSYDWNFGFFNANIDSPIIKRVFKRAGSKIITSIVSDGFFEIEKSWVVNVVKPIISSTPEDVSEPVVLNSQSVEMISFTI